MDEAKYKICQEENLYEPRFHSRVEVKCPTVKAIMKWVKSKSIQKPGWARKHTILNLNTNLFLGSQKSHVNLTEFKMFFSIHE